MLLRAGLVNEVSIVISPYLVGGLSNSSIFRVAGLEETDSAIKTRLLHLEKLRDDNIWLRYEIIR